MTVIQDPAVRSLLLCQQFFRIFPGKRQYRHKVPGFQFPAGAAGKKQQDQASDNPCSSEMPQLPFFPCFSCLVFFFPLHGSTLPFRFAFPATARMLSHGLPIHRRITRNATLTGTVAKLFHLT